jgi:hypothetical protein
MSGGGKTSVKYRQGASYKTMNTWQKYTESWKHNWITRIITVIFLLFLVALVAYLLQELDTFRGSIWNDIGAEIYEFLDEWAIIISAGVTLLLAVTVGWVVMDNHHDKKVDRALRLQNEVVVWAVEVMETIPLPSAELKAASNEAIREKLTGLSATSIIAGTKANELMPGSELKRKIDTVSNSLEEFVQNLEQTTDNNPASIENQRDNLKKALLDIIKSASSVTVT